MIKAEVVFDGNKIIIRGFEISASHNIGYQIKKNGLWVDTKNTLEKAIAYCLEN